MWAIGNGSCYTMCMSGANPSEIVLNSPVLQAGLSLYFCDRDTSTTSALVTASAIDSKLVYAEKDPQNMNYICWDPSQIIKNV